MNYNIRFCGILLGTLLVLILSCSGTQSPPIQPDLPDYKNVVITMDRIQCYGPCPVYSVTINGDGSLVYEGQSNVEVTGTQTDQIPAEDVRDLVDEFIRIGFFSLEDRYTVPTTDGPTFTDGPTTITTLTLDGETKQVENYSRVHFELGQLENLIDEVAHTAQWVEPSD